MEPSYGTTTELPKDQNIEKSMTYDEHHIIINNVEVIVKEEPDFPESDQPLDFGDLYLGTSVPENHMQYETDEQHSSSLTQRDTNADTNGNESPVREVSDYITLRDKEIFEKGKSRKKQKKSYECPSCTKIFSKFTLWKEHIKEEHDCSELYLCDHNCKDFFNSDHDFKLHLPLHGEGPAWPCPECKKEFNDRSRLRRHIKLHMTKREFACERCKKRFATLQLLRRHAHAHGVPKKHACHLCDKMFAWPSELAIHVRRHSGVKPFACEQCGRGFVSRKALSSHSPVHSKNRPYDCRFCGKLFRSNSNRATHERLHTGERPYVCATCGKGFPQGNHLKVHARTHAADQQGNVHAQLCTQPADMELFQCEICSRTFEKKAHLANHIKIHIEAGINVKKEKPVDPLQGTTL